MKIFRIVPLDSGKLAINQKGDKKLKKMLSENFNDKSVIVFSRHKSKRSLPELYSHKIIFLNDGDANLLLLTIDKKEFRLTELTDEQYTIL